ncbi:MAG: hypothetical protein KAI16_02595 [Candidatus Pacebacteria bacterium]|nr:hypothetical protein [Candidatus Paceibacterota bacterium]
MKKINELNLLKNDLSHFYIILGDEKKNKKDVLDFLKEKINFIYQKNSDFFDFSGSDLFIDQVRKIKSINSVSKKQENKYRIFFLDYKKWSIESQNAFLKTLEEPLENTIFFLFITNSDILLDTIKSRAQILKGYIFLNQEDGENFLKLEYQERIKIIKKLESEQYLDFLDSIENALLENKKNIENISEVFKKFLELKSQSKFKGSNVNYILEFLALYLPKIK